MKVFGHRGASGYKPENTLASFSKAIDLKVDMIELDVQVLTSGELVVIHDNKVDRTTNGTGYVAEFTIEEFRKLDAGNGEKIPLLSEVLDLVNKAVPINIELKGLGAADKVAEMIGHYTKDNGWKSELFVVSSFNHVELQHFKTLMPNIAIGALTAGIPADYAAFAQRLDAFSVNPSAEFITPSFVKDAHSRGLEVHVFTVDDESEIKRMQALEVDGIFSNFTDKARQFLAS